MDVDLFNFELPKKLIALRPASSRDGARLLVVDGKNLEDKIVSQIPDYLAPRGFDDF